MNAQQFMLQLWTALWPLCFSIVGIALLVIATRVHGRTLEARDVAVITSLRNRDISTLLGIMEADFERETGAKPPPEYVTERLLTELHIDENCQKNLQRSGRLHLYALMLTGLGNALIFYPVFLMIRGWLS